MTTTDTANQPGTVHIKMPAQEFAQRLGMGTDRTWITPLAITVDGDDVTIHGDAPEGSHGEVREDGSMALVVADRPA